uniref:BPTI/Kunitz inhibitor domain-containing protein n=1 Tax=Oryzias sinensis TaxID=183150 RepID=A0A8C7YWL1_9TELE
LFGCILTIKNEEIRESGHSLCGRHTACHLKTLCVGPCRAAFPRWQYNATQGLCTEFHFGGCNANENNYLSENDCMSACEGVKGKPLKISHKKTSVTNDKDCSIYFQCTDAPRTGPCRASIPRWFYDPLKLKCYSFIFGGCNGNENNFEDETTCMETCKDVSGTNYTHIIHKICGGSASLTSKERKAAAGFLPCLLESLMFCRSLYTQNFVSLDASPRILFSNVTQTRKYFMLQPL